MKNKNKLCILFQTSRQKCNFRMVLYYFEKKGEVFLQLKGF